MRDPKVLQSNVAFTVQDGSPAFVAHYATMIIGIMAVRLDGQGCWLEQYSE